ncbi:acyl-CoA thioesterase domain-containing protein [Mycobacterium sp. 1274756.6]|uniref:acyl-CoA thioesterase n=1 Tax=Mycobacterium sp. 1274756.6 TaxID=1834076 RepID=UPI0008020F9E|nr:acyl-CoA thioesterase domain-containing protein [Mycobacterium sp. 1274756.6]OBJ71695.1 acyl-CoA thioesterase II [Mycobacterium sp. 1274756.6]
MTATEDGDVCHAGAGAHSWIARLLRLDRDGDTFVVTNSEPGRAPRLFGGLIAAQALYAAGRTVDADKRPQSLHLYFVRGGRYGVPVEYGVQRIRTGRSFDTRQVSVRQDGAVILELIASFHRPEPGADWHPAAAATLEFADAVPKSSALGFSDRFEIRTAPDDTSPFAVPPYWIRSREPVGDDPLVQACTLTFFSDLGPLPTARPPGTPLALGVGFATSLDHSVWFHRPFRPEQWHRYEVTSVNNSDARGLARGALYDADGALVASTAQEALWRL